jgi:hypothetical protein
MTDVWDVIFGGFLFIVLCVICFVIIISAKGCNGVEGQTQPSVDALKALYSYGNRPFVELEQSGYEIRPSNWVAGRDWQEYRVWNEIKKDKEYAVIVRKDTVKDIHIAWY